MKERSGKLKRWQILFKNSMPEYEKIFQRTESKKKKKKNPPAKKEKNSINLYTHKQASQVAQW